MADSNKGASRALCPQWSVGDRVAEPWGFVTEPYSTLTETERLASTLNAELVDWGIEVSALPEAKSAWLPGRCTPIVTRVVPNNLNAFLRLGVGAALATMAHRL